jgi:ubiquinone/menaquinone biosynthesis C-methylase UbiE
VNAQQRLNYDRIAHIYDEPFRDHASDPHLARFLAERRDLEPGNLRVLDMGYGTGKQLSANRGDYPAALLVGRDLFRGMLAHARKRGPDVCWFNGDSARAPFADASFDYITNQFSYPHVLNKSELWAETFRLLKPGGRFVLTNIDPWLMQDWAIYRYFPTALTRDFRDYLPTGQLVAALEQAGFAEVEVDYRHVYKDERLADVLAFVGLRARTSQLMAISDAEYDAGLAKVRADIAERGDDAPVSSHLCYITVQAQKG